jgi:hypothetical protein
METLNGRFLAVLAFRPTGERSLGDKFLYLWNMDSHGSQDYIYCFMFYQVGLSLRQLESILT